MSTPEEEKLNKIDKLKNKLFSRGYETQIDHHDGYAKQKKDDVPDSWNDGQFKKNNDFLMKNSIFKKFFIFSIFFFCVALIYVGYMFFAGSNTVSNANIDINVIGNAFTDGGEDLPLVIEVVNRNSTALELADLVVEYPKGSLSEGTERLRSSLGTIEPGSTYSENVDVVLFGEQGSISDIKISLEYRLEGSNSIFVKEKDYEVSINSTPIELVVDAPTEVSPNQDVVFNIKATLNSTRSTSNMLMRLDYPVGFQYVSSTPEPTYGNNVWDLSSLKPGAEMKVVLIGKMLDVFDGEEKTFHVFSGLRSESDKSEVGIVFNSLSHTLAIKKPFIEAQLVVNGAYDREYAVSTRSTIQGQIRWRNNLDTKINDLVITARITGNAFDRKTINAQQGFFNSAEDYLIWDKNSIKDFAEVTSGEAGAVGFSVSPIALFSAEGGLVNSPTVNIEVSISGKQALEGNVLKELKNSESKTVKIISDTTFASSGLYYSGPFKNTGPMPPKAEQETSYTITWTLSNTSNTISKAQVKATLPSWVRYVGQASPASESLVYNSAAREVVWNAGTIQKGAGITGASKEVSFQVALTPSISQVGEAPVLVNSSVLTGHDDFANVGIEVKRSAITTRISNDPLFLPENSRVVE